ncbi:membrane protein [Saccharothrix violaceirubra]
MGRSAAKRFEPGRGALVIAVAVLVVLVSLVLPWVGGDPGLSVLAGPAPAVPRVFAYLALVSGVLLPAVTLGLRRWVLAWVSALGCFAATVCGVLSIWTTQTTTGHHPGPGPGFGLILAVLAVATLLVRWLRIAASRH